MPTERECLVELTKTVCKSIIRLNEVLEEEDPKTRYKKAARVLKELEVVNDEAMRSALGLTVSKILQLKMSGHSGAKSKAPRSGADREPRQMSPHQQLMEHHAKHVIGDIPDGAAQGAAIKWILERFTPELAIKRYDEQLHETWRKGRVNWLTVRQDLGRIRVEPTQEERESAERDRWALEVEREHGITRKDVDERTGTIQ